MPATLMGAYPQSLCMPPRQTINTHTALLICLNLLVLAGIKDIWQLQAEPWTPSSRGSSRRFPASFCKRSRAAFNYTATMAPIPPSPQHLLLRVGVLGSARTPPPTTLREVMAWAV